MNSMEYGKAFSFFTEDSEWVKKFLIAAIMPIIPIVGGFVLAGYGLEITRRVIKNETPVLPEWSDFGEYLKNGFFSFVIGFIYSLPIILVSICFNGPSIALQTQNDNNLQLTGSILMICGGCLISVLALAASLLIAPALGRFADTGQWTSALRVGEAFALLRTKPGVYLISGILIGVAALVLVPLGFVLCGVGIFLAATFINLAASHLQGQAYRVAAAEAGLSL
jgi:hypothetical protein